METMTKVLGELEGNIAKNLFLKDKKKRLFLYSGRHDRDVKLNDIGKKVGANGALRFADESVLEETLGVKQGCVTAFALINDINKCVTFCIDDDLINGQELIYFHPLDNSASSGISPDDLKKFLQEVGHDPVVVKY